MKFYLFILVLLLEICATQSIDQLIQRYKSMINRSNSLNVEKENITQNIDFKKSFKKAISLNEYILGPNDVLEIIVNYPENSESHEKRINFSGYIMFPFHGKVILKGETIASAEKKIEEIFEKRYSSVNVDISIKGYREFSVLVKWGFNRSDYIEVNSFFRISDIIEKLYDEKKLKSDFLISHKNIKHIRSEVVQNVNLQDFYLTNNYELNPLIIEQDIIEIFKPINYLSIKGPEDFNAIYEFNDGETYFEFLNKVNYNKNILESDRILIYRSNKLLIEVIDLEELKKIKILNLDVIVINEKNNYQPYAIVLEGQVSFPGTYIIDFNGLNKSSTLEQVISQAGGLTDKADISNISISNNFIKNTNDFELEKIKIILKNEDFTKKISESDISYIRNRLLFPRGTIRSKTYEHAAQLLEINLFPGDQIYIPSKMDFIEVIGAVQFPGRIQYADGVKASEYLEMAGGLNSNYNKKFIVKKSSGEKIKFQKFYVLEPGDIIFVSDSMEYNRWEYFKEILSVTSQIATIFIIIDGAFR